jgi:hypothetical protein
MSTRGPWNQTRGWKILSEGGESIMCILQRVLLILFMSSRQMLCNEPRGEVAR